jgi:hypothetical protein
VAAGPSGKEFDVRGNKAQIDAGSLAFQVSAFFGGVDTDSDAVRASIEFLNEDRNQISVPTFGPVTTADRNSETVLLKRERTDIVPVGTHYITLDLIFLHLSGGPSGLVDKVSARLIPTPSPTPIPFEHESHREREFESGPLPGSPLTPTDPHGWFGSVHEAPYCRMAPAPTCP